MSLKSELIMKNFKDLFYSGIHIYPSSTLNNYQLMAHFTSTLLTTTTVQLHMEYFEANSRNYIISSKNKQNVKHFYSLDLRSSLLPQSHQASETELARFKKRRVEKEEWGESILIQTPLLFKQKSIYFESVFVPLENSK